MVNLRLFSVFGPRQRPDMAFSKFFRALCAGESLEVFGDGQQTRDFTHVQDVVRAFRLAAEVHDVGSRTYNVGGGARTSLAEVISIIEEITGSTARIEHLPAVLGDVRDTGADTTRATAALGFQPRTSLRAGLQSQYEWTLSLNTRDRFSGHAG